MQLPPPAPSTNANNNNTSSQDSNAEETERDMGEVDGGVATKIINGDGDNESLASVSFATASTDPAAAKDLEDAITAYLRRATENFDLSKNVEVRTLFRMESKFTMLKYYMNWISIYQIRICK